MLILVCGPSGAGKTTLLREVVQRTSSKVINVAVSRVQSRSEYEPGREVMSSDDFERIRSSFQYVYEYQRCLYGFPLTLSDIETDTYVFLDYPGEYPMCSELPPDRWRGVLVLPSNARSLELRLKTTERVDRIASAILEYQECCAEVDRGLYAPEQWRIYVSRNAESLRLLVDDIQRHTLFRDDGDTTNYRCA